MEQRYQERLNRYVTALRNGKADRVPIRPFVAEFVGRYAGFTCQELAHDYELAFEAARKCAADFDWDAVVANMVYVWTGLTQAIGLRYYGVPGIDVPPDTGFQYREPEEAKAWMRPDEYDALIDDPTGFLFNVWLPRVSADVVAPGEPATFRNNLSFLKGGMAMMSYFFSFPGQAERLRRESGTAPAIAGILKAPLDIIADKLRGYEGLVSDLLTQPDKVLAACEALAPHLAHVALAGADPDGNVPVGFWMHRSCVPFIMQEHFDRLFWPTLKPIIEELWLKGHQTLFYAEGNWDAHLESFAELPDQSIVYHVDQGDIFRCHEALGSKFCISGGLPNYLLAYGTPEEVRAYCRKIIEGVAQDGGYIMDASAIIQNDAKVENVQAMTEAAREYGVYSQSGPAPARPESPEVKGLAGWPEKGGAAPGVCVPWEVKRQELGAISGDEGLVKRVWESNEGWAYMYVWHCLLSF
ncbi:MAG: hypothetical protein JXR94_13285 [Candidatus Hydrogenedentes bacterium]|nr:hypothetical protein [Candidatus Hydrogenedentota bacterium]